MVVMCGDVMNVGGSKAWVPNGPRSGVGNKENTDNSKRHAYLDAVSTPVSRR